MTLENVPIANISKQFETYTDAEYLGSSHWRKPNGNNPKTHEISITHNRNKTPCLLLWMDDPRRVPLLFLSQTDKKMQKKIYLYEHTTNQKGGRPPPEEEKSCWIHNRCPPWEHPRSPLTPLLPKLTPNFLSFMNFAYCNFMIISRFLRPSSLFRMMADLWWDWTSRFQTPNISSRQFFLMSIQVN